MFKALGGKRTQNVGITSSNNVSIVCTLCWVMLHDVGTCCVKFESSQTFDLTSANIFFVFVRNEACRNMLRSFAGRLMVMAVVMVIVLQVGIRIGMEVQAHKKRKTQS